MDEYGFGSSDDGSDSSSGLDLITALANNATSAYETTAALNANPLNTALIYGGTASTAQGAVGSALISMPSSGTWLFLIVIALIAFVFYHESEK